MVDGLLMLNIRVNVLVVDTSHLQSNKFVTGEEIKASSDSKAYDLQV